MTPEQALQILQGNPTQEELFSALLVLAESDELTYVGALPRAIEILEQMNPGQGITKGQVNAVVRQLQTQTPGATSPEVQTTSPGTTAPPPVPPEEQEQRIPPAIGVQPGFTVPRQGEDVSDRAFRRARGQPDRIEPRYRAGDEFRFQFASTTEIRRMQRELEAAGLLESDAYTPGFWDQASANALSDAMAFANRGGSSYEDVISQLKQLPRQVEPKEQFEIPPALQAKVDPASVEQRVKAEFRGKLGREPTDAEMAEFAGYLSGQYEKARQQAIGRAEAEFDAANPQETEGPAYGGGVGGMGTPASDTTMGSFIPIDPVANFNQFFDRRRGPEREFVEGQAETAQNMRSVFESLRTMSGLIG